MRDWKGNEYSWPTRNATERRVHPRVQVGFPVEIRHTTGDNGLPGVATDVSLGGLRIAVPTLQEATAKLLIDFTLAVTNRDGNQEQHSFRAPASVVRCTQGPAIAPSKAEAQDFELSVRFSDDDKERERIIGVFMLQTLLFVPDAQLR